MIEGRGPDPFRVLALIEALPENSLTHALRAGGRQYWGWDEDRAIRASIFDAIMSNTRSRGNFKKMPPVITYPRPKAPKKVTVKDLYAKYTMGV